MNDLNHPIYKFYNAILQGSILIFSAALVYFAFVYYPQAIRQYESGNIPAQKPLVAPVSAVFQKLPIETDAYRITYEKDTDSYYVFISGNTLDQYVVNQNGARLALMSALSSESLCSYNVVYVSSANLQVPDQYKASDCM
ncbi:hypothetical protein A2W15_06140 [Candidatus Woesebacteria bacterium RBG_16_41_13]|nr:MAG: hypothetical protein A2W15_06140 [Candidatus Woesebacteria bacterium RBG_16_41_13]